MSNQAKKPIESKQDVKKPAQARSPFLMRLFGRKQAMSIFEEEQIQSPFRTVLKTFRGNKVGMTALTIFLLIFATVTIGPKLKPIDLSYSDSSQINIAPGFDMMKVPEELKSDVKYISVGPTFSIGVSEQGKVFVWGKSRITGTINMKNVPSNMGKVVQVAAGFDHALALNDQGELFGWGSDRQKQIEIPAEVAALKNIKNIYAGYQCSVVLTEDGRSYFFGNTRVNDYFAFHPYQGQLSEIVIAADSFGGLTFDGEFVFLGTQVNSYSRIPENMGTLVDITATAATFGAVNEDGEVFIWGNPSPTKGEARVPETDSKITNLYGGRYHYVALTESNELIAWGANEYNQSSVPAKISNADIVTVFNGFFQNYALTSTGEVLTWGLKGYLCGTDELGRDIFTRLLNGGRMTMTIGGVAVVISTTIAIIVGGLSGYFGGKLDNFLQRLSEMVGSLPFLPFAMILSALIGNNMTGNQKIFLIMIILGLLSWPGLQRLIRAQVLSVREQEYVTAAKVVGINQFNIVFKHIIPNVVSIIIVSATLGFSTSMLTESSLSFLGFGVQAPQPTWGNMLNGARNSVVIQNYWWRWVFASIVLSVCVICINLIGESLRDAIDPKSQER